MADQNFLREYLVKLGFQTDRHGLDSFARSLRDVQSLIDNRTFSIAKRFTEMQGAITGAFGAAAASAIGLADRVAMNDQQYRMLALRMYTTTGVARTLKIAMDALGQPLENIAWDPELAARFNHLVNIQRTMTREIGGQNFEKQMRQLRDLHYEVSYFWVELKYLAMYLVKDFRKILGVNLDDILGKFKSWNAWIVEHLPEIGDWIERWLAGPITDLKEVLGETWQMIKMSALAFTNLVGLLSGDSSIEGTAFNFEKFARAVQHSIHFISQFALSMIHLEEIVVHAINAMVALGHLDVGTAWKELKAGARLLDTGTLTTLGTGVGFALGGPGGALVGAGIGQLAGLGADTIHDVQRGNVRQEIATTAQSMGVPPSLALAVAQIESGIRQFGPSGDVLVNRGEHGESHATGIFQLQPGTAKMLGVDPEDVHGNIKGGVTYLRDLLARYHGSTEQALEHYYGSRDVAANQAYARKVMAAEQKFVFGDVHVTVQGSQASADEIGHAVAAHQKQQFDQATMRNVQEFASAGVQY